MNWRELVESFVVMACGFVLLSPEFNTYLHIPVLDWIEHVPSDIISHLAVALLPIIIVYMVWSKWMQLSILAFAMVLMLSKHYVILHNFFSFFYESELSVISVAIGGFAVAHGVFVMFRALLKEG